MIDTTEAAQKKMKKDGALMTAAEKFAKFLKKKVLTVFSTESTDKKR